MLSLPNADMLQQYLDLQTQQMRVTAGNMANVETPGYRTEGIDFQGEFARALQSHGPIGDAATHEVDGLITRPDGNNVSMDRESAQMAQTQLQFRAGIELLRHQFSMVSDAIKSDGK